MVRLSKGKRIVFSIMVGLLVYLVFIGSSYQLFKIRINHQLKVAINSSSNDTTDTYLYYVTGHKGIVGYVFYRTKSIPASMVEIYERARIENIVLSNFQGTLGEIYRFAVMVFLPLICHLEPKNGIVKRRY
jgi:hypothetical protein